MLILYIMCDVKEKDKIDRSPYQQLQAEAVS